MQAAVLWWNKAVLHQLRDWTKFLQSVSFFLTLAHINWKNIKCKIHAVFSNDRLQI